jgi:surface protein
MNKTIYKTAGSLLLFTLLLTGCNGGNDTTVLDDRDKKYTNVDNTDDTTVTNSSFIITGTIKDENYISSTVCLDINRNDTCDTDTEPTTNISTDKNFTFTVTDENQQANKDYYVNNNLYEGYKVIAYDGYEEGTTNLNTFIYKSFYVKDTPTLLNKLDTYAADILEINKDNLLLKNQLTYLGLSYNLYDTNYTITDIKNKIANLLSTTILELDELNTNSLVSLAYKNNIKLEYSIKVLKSIMAIANKSATNTLIYKIIGFKLNTETYNSVESLMSAIMTDLKLDKSLIETYLYNVNKIFANSLTRTDIDNKTFLFDREFLYKLLNYEVITTATEFNVITATEVGLMSELILIDIAYQNSDYYDLLEKIKTIFDFNNISKNSSYVDIVTILKKYTETKNIGTYYETFLNSTLYTENNLNITISDPLLTTADTLTIGLDTVYPTEDVIFTDLNGTINSNVVEVQVLVINSIGLTMESKYATIVNGIWSVNNFLEPTPDDYTIKIIAKDKYGATNEIVSDTITILSMIIRITSTVNTEVPALETMSGTLTSNVVSIEAKVLRPDSTVAETIAVPITGDTWDIASFAIVADGQYTVELTSTDAANQTYVIETATINVEAVKPITLTLDTGYATSSEILPTITGTMSSNVKTIEIEVLDINSNIIETKLATPNALTWSATGFKSVIEGDYTYNIKATDKYGNTGTTQSTTLTILPLSVSLTTYDTFVNLINTISGTNTADTSNIKIDIKDSSNSIIATNNIVISNGATNWTADITNQLSPGNYTLDITATNADSTKTKTITSNQITVATYPICETQAVGTIYNYQGIDYTVVDNSSILQLTTDIINGVKVNSDMTTICTTQVTDMSDLFLDMTTFNLSLSNFDTRNVINMSGMFRNASSFNQPLSNFKTTNVDNMSRMFEGATAFNQPLTSFDTLNVQYMHDMFKSASAFNNDISSFATVNVTNMSGMFYGAIAFNQPLSNFNTIVVSDMSFMFYGTDIFNQSLSNFNTVNVTLMNSMFQNALLFNQPLTSFTTTAVTDMRDMFSGAAEFDNDISTFNTLVVQNMSNMFAQAVKFNQPLPNTFTTAAVIDMLGMFYGATLFNQSLISFDTTQVIAMGGMFYEATSFNQSLSHFITTNTSDMSFMFYSASSFIQDISSWTVPLINTEPNNFSTLTDTAWTAGMKPTW